MEPVYLSLSHATSGCSSGFWDDDLPGIGNLHTERFNVSIVCARACSPKHLSCVNSGFRFRFESLQAFRDISRWRSTKIRIRSPGSTWRRRSCDFCEASRWIQRARLPICFCSRDGPLSGFKRTGLSTVLPCVEFFSYGRTFKATLSTRDILLASETSLKRINSDSIVHSRNESPFC